MRRFVPAGALALVLLSSNTYAAPAPVDRVLGDAGALATAPAEWDGAAWGALAFAAAGGVALYQRDGDIRKFNLDHRGSAGNRIAEVGNTVGDGFYLLPALAAGALAGRVADRPRLEATGWTALEAVLFAGGATVGLKAALGRARPRAEQGPHDWTGPRTGPDHYLSFPSGHASNAFAAASVFAVSYPGTPVPYAAYGLATVAAFARVEKDAHWASDVWGGAAIGLWVGHTLANRHPSSPAAPRLALLPLPGGAEAVWTWRR